MRRWLFGWWLSFRRMRSWWRAKALLVVILAWPRSWRRSEWVKCAGLSWVVTLKLQSHQIYVFLDSTRGSFHSLSNSVGETGKGDCAVLCPLGTFGERSSGGTEGWLCGQGFLCNGPEKYGIAYSCSWLQATWAGWSRSNGNVLKILC